MENTPNNQRPRPREGGSEMMKWIERTALLSLIFGFFLIDEKGKVTLLAWVGGTAYILTMIFVYFRLKNQEIQTDIQTEQFKAQAEKEINDRFHSAVALLGNSETSARTGAIYFLYHLAVESEKYRSQVAELLCSHIRSKTEESKYQKHYSACPSNEIQTAINLLFVKTGSLNGLYAQFYDNLPQANLSKSYLVGANFIGMMCWKVNFWGAYLQDSYFGGTECQGGNFTNTDCQGAHFILAHFQGASFTEARCQGAYFDGARCQGAYFCRAQCQGASFRGANFKGACSDVNLFYSKLSDRIGQSTELDMMIVAGHLNEESTASIDRICDAMPANWQKRMREIIQDHKGVPPVSATASLPRGMISGVLEDTPDIRQISEDIGR